LVEFTHSTDVKRRFLLIYHRARDRAQRPQSRRNRRQLVNCEHGLL